MIDLLLGMPVLVKVLGALSLILALSRVCKHLTIAVLVAAVVLGLWSGHSPASMLDIAWQRVSSFEDLVLLFVVLEVIWLSSQMAATGVMEDLVKSVRGRVSRRTSMAVLPAVIGLLPMPGGALFSAPLVDRCDENGEVHPGLKAQTNHWFRHIWEYWWPLYPGVLLAMQEAKLDIWQFVLLQLPLTLFAIGAGYLFLLRRIEGGTRRASGLAGEDVPAFLPLVLPIIVVIASYAVVRLSYWGVRTAWMGVPEMNRYLPMALGLLAAILVLQARRPIDSRRWWKILFARRAMAMLIIVAAVRVYGAFIDAELPGGQPLAELLRFEMAAWGIPLIAIVMLLPLVSGLATGLSIGFVGASFPIIVSLLGPAPSTGALLSTVVLAYGFGYMGMLLSPVHVCLVVTSEHFETRLLRNMAGLLMPAIAMLIAAFCMHSAVAWIFH